LLEITLSLIYTDVDCGPPGELENGNVRLQHGRTTHGAAAIYECSDNYTIQGTEKRECGDNGLWSSDQPHCLCKQLSLT
jgi:hypothetical protein